MEEKRGRGGRRRTRELGASQRSWRAEIPRLINTLAFAAYSGQGWSEPSFIPYSIQYLSRFSPMPKVNSHAPAWLCRPSPGASLFSSTSVKSPAQDLTTGPKAGVASGATRTIAERGNEVFVVVDNEIRWSNLARLKDRWQQRAKQKKAPAGLAKEQANGAEIPSYRVSLRLVVS